MTLLRRVGAGFAAVRDELSRSVTVGSSPRHLEAAITWLCHSQDVTDCGGSAATYNLVLGWADAYPETTGYIVPTLLTYAERADTPEIAERAVRMADWLCSVQSAEGWFPGGTGRGGEPSVFNTGQIVFGLVAAYRSTRANQYRDAARAACDWLVDEQTADGRWERYDYNDTVHVYSTRIAWALLEAASVLPSRQAEYRDAAYRNFSWAVDCQRPNGWFEQAGFEPGESPYLHTLAYTVRGLLEGGLGLEEPQFVDAARRTADELLGLHRRDGVLKGAYGPDWSPAWYYCLPGNAQTVLIWLRLAQHTGDPAYREAATDTIEFLKRKQSLRGPPEVRGGLAGSAPIVGRYMFLRYPNWGAKFLADALLVEDGARITGLTAGDTVNLGHN